MRAADVAILRVLGSCRWRFSCGPTGKYAVKTRFKLAIALLFILLAVGALAVPWYSSRTLDTQIKAWADQPGQGTWQLQKVAHQAGFFASSGSAELQFRQRCTPGGDQAPVALTLAYRVSHVPTRSGLGQFTWTLAPSGAHSVAALAGFAGLTANGVIGFDGAVSSDVALPALTWGADLQEVNIAASKAQLRLNGNAATLHWNVDDMDFKAKETSLSLHGTRLSLALDDLQGATGSVALDVDDARAGAVSLQGLKLHNELREVAQRWNYQQSVNVRSLQWMGRTLSDVALQGKVTGLHAKSAQTLSSLFSETCGFADGDTEKLALARQALKTMLVSGFSFGIPSLKARDADASVDAHVLLELLPAAHGEVALAQQLQSSGEMVVKGGMLTPEQAQIAMQSGYVQEVPGGLKMSYRYAQGALTVGGQPRDASLVPLVLTRVDGLFNALLTPTGGAAPL